MREVRVHILQGNVLIIKTIITHNQTLLLHMTPQLGGMHSLIQAYDALGLPAIPLVTPPDVSLEAILGKITNPGIATALGASQATVAAIHRAELTANLLDAYSETGDRAFLVSADAEYRTLLGLLPPDVSALVQSRGAAALPYFLHEQDVAGRISRGEFFLEEEVAAHLLWRGSDAPIYSAILLADGIMGPGHTAGFRLRQGLSDLVDDIRDLEQDMRGIGVNLLLMSTVGTEPGLRNLAMNLYNQARLLPLPTPLLRAIEREYEQAIALLH